MLYIINSRHSDRVPSIDGEGWIFDKRFDFGRDKDAEIKFICTMVIDWCGLKNKQDKKLKQMVNNLLDYLNMFQNEYVNKTVIFENKVSVREAVQKRKRAERVYIKYMKSIDILNEIDEYDGNIFLEYLKDDTDTHKHELDEMLLATFYRSGMSRDVCGQGSNISLRSNRLGVPIELVHVYNEIVQAILYMVNSASFAQDRVQDFDLIEYTRRLEFIECKIDHADYYYTYWINN